MNLHKLRVFCEVVERQSLTLAAQHLIVSQPVISVHIRDLERFFHAKLLYQRGRRMVPTEAGEAVYRYALEVLRSTDETLGIVRVLETGEAGHVSIGANLVAGTYVVPAKLVDFKLRHPGVEIAFTMSDSVTICEHIHKGIYDFGIIDVPEPPQGLCSEVLAYEPLVLVVSPQHRFAVKRSVGLDALQAQRFVCRPGGGDRGTVIESQLRALGLTQRRLEMTMSHPEAMKQAVMRGVGIAVMFRCTVERELQSGELVEIEIEGHQLSHPLYAVYSAGKRFSPVQQRLLDFLRAAPQPVAVGANGDDAGSARRDRHPTSTRQEGDDRAVSHRRANAHLESTNGHI